MLYGTSDSEPQTDIVVAQLSQELYNSGLLVLLIQNLSRVDFEVSSSCLTLLLRLFSHNCFHRARKMSPKSSIISWGGRLERDHPLLSTSARNQKFFSCWFKGRCYIYLFSNHLVDTVYAPFRYEHQEIALNCGTMLRECARYEALAKILLYSEDFYNFFKFVEVSTFDIASDAFSTFKVTPRLYLVSASIIFFL